MNIVDKALSELAQLCESGSVPSAEEFCSKYGDDPSLRLAVDDFLFMWNGIRPESTPVSSPLPGHRAAWTWDAWQDG